MAEEQVCVCGHTKAAHQHFRPGNDCGRCGAAGCPKFKRDRKAGAQAEAQVDPVPETDSGRR